MIPDLAGALVGFFALVVAAVVVRLIKRWSDRRQQARALAARPAASRQVRRAEDRKRPGCTAR
ncbi:hypothetical protein [Xylophilus ampelinus]|uniref:Uncharacterized protein n=1 Tax=Xylophilus ampelinus TaxID=54067 RepID=A0A318SK99_9BURK|nr:hypothetical protein [Xylophilus ampelinus]MCS4508803.1 hypothetical protein [Xylophilus ampelinus]PYE79373.1 hypothetical protein DFQ15_102105 [Xylophilus ampelinus]